MPSGKRSWPASLASPGAAGPAGPAVAAAAGAPAPDPKIISRIIIFELKKLFLCSPNKLN